MSNETIFKAILDNAAIHDVLAEFYVRKMDKRLRQEGVLEQ